MLSAGASSLSTSRMSWVVRSRSAFGCMGAIIRCLCARALPFWRGPDVFEAQTKRARAHDVTEHGHPLVQRQPKRVVRVHLANQAVVHRFGLFHEGAEEPVEDD